MDYRRANRSESVAKQRTAEAAGAVEYKAVSREALMLISDGMSYQEAATYPAAR
jgi:hypothetical protein